MSTSFLPLEQSFLGGLSRALPQAVAPEDSINLAFPLASGLFFPPGGNTRPTNDYLQVIQAADAMGNRDTRLTFDEARNLYLEDQRRLEFVRGILPLFLLASPQQSFPLFQISTGLQNRLAAGLRIMQNFKAFAQGGFSKRFGDDPQTATVLDLLLLAGRDGNSNDVSQKDLTPPATPGGTGGTATAGTPTGTAAAGTTTPAPTTPAR